MRLLLLAGAASLAATASWAQDDDAGAPLLSVGIVQNFTVDDNYRLDDPSAGTSFYADTRLVVGLLNETQTQTFALGLDTGLRALWEAEEDFDLTFASPSTATLDYGREWASGSIDTFLNYRQRELDDTSFVFEFDETGAVDDIREIRNDATERRYDGGVALELATESPSSYELNLEATRFDYSGGDDTENTPRTTVLGSALWLLQVTPTLAGAFGAGFSNYDADNPQETRIRQTEVDAGVIYDASEVLQLRFGVGWATYLREERDGTGARQTLDDEQGYVLRGAVRYLFEDVTVDADARLTNAAPSTRLSGAVRLAYPLPNGALTGRVFRRFGGGDAGDEIRVTGAGIGVEREINSVSRLGFELALARQEELDTEDPDTDRADFTATYSYDVTEAVSASLGYRFRARDEDPDEARSNAVFFEIGRAFETRP